MAEEIFFLSLCCFAAVVVASNPQLPSTYHATGSIFLPKGDIVEPFEAWVNNDKGMSRIDYYHGKVTQNFACQMANNVT